MVKEEMLKVCVLGTEPGAKQSKMMQALKMVTGLVAQTVETVAEGDLIIAYSLNQFEKIKDKHCATPSFNLFDYFHFISRVAKEKKKVVVSVFDEE